MPTDSSLSRTCRGFLRAVVLAGLCGFISFRVCGAAVDLTKAADLWDQSVTLEKNSDYKGALAKIAELGRAGGDPYLVNLRVGWLYLLSKDYDHAITYYRAASGYAPGAITPLIGLAGAYRGRSDNDNAERVCRQVLTRDTGNAAALQILGAIYFDKKAYPNAASTYDTLLKLYPEDPDALSGYGWAKIYLGLKADALPAFQRLLIVSPSYSHAQDGYKAATTP